jgi:VanZ family protein
MAVKVEVGGGGPRIGRRWLAVAGYVALIFTLSAQTGLQVPGTFAYRDKIAHILEYGGLGMLLWLAARDTWPSQRPLNRALVVWIAIMALGAIDEKFQAGIPGRESSVYDWMADSTGALLSQLWGLSREMRREVG